MNKSIPDIETSVRLFVCRFGQSFSFSFHAAPADLFEEMVSFEVRINYSLGTVRNRCMSLAALLLSFHYTAVSIIIIFVIIIIASSLSLS